MGGVRGGVEVRVRWGGVSDGVRSGVEVGVEGREAIY